MNAVALGLPDHEVAHPEAAGGLLDEDQFVPAVPVLEELEPKLLLEVQERGVSVPAADLVGRLAVTSVHGGGTIGPGKDQLHRYLTLSVFSPLLQAASRTPASKQTSRGSGRALAADLEL